MSNVTSILELSGEELDLLVTATSAYQHHEKFRALHRKLETYLNARRIFHPEPFEPLLQECSFLEEPDVDVPYASTNPVQNARGF